MRTYPEIQFGFNGVDAASRFAVYTVHRHTQLSFPALNCSCAPSQVGRDLFPIVEQIRIHCAFLPWKEFEPGGQIDCTAKTHDGLVRVGEKSNQDLRRIGGGAQECTAGCRGAERLHRGRATHSRSREQVSRRLAICLRRLASRRKREVFFSGRSGKPLNLKQLTSW